MTYMSTAATSIPAPSTEWEAVNLAGAHWRDAQGRGRSFGAARPGFGIRHIATGHFASSDGEHPATWTRKADATVHAQYPSPKFTLVPVVFP